MAVISAFSLYDTTLRIADDEMWFELNGAGGMRYETLLERTSLEGKGPVQRRSESGLLRENAVTSGACPASGSHSYRGE
ncbi:hypothetical protein P9222_27775 [Paenibacillus amylolyticus]|nr:hypothetical protein [Paenibacillus amylolyticus]WFR62034.1 hypothetical protein P9222_27775 [Paenibacillus amylolyticus]